MNYTYILKCADETLYCGWTNCLEKRLKAHNKGNGAKYTKSRRPVTLVYFEEFETQGEAMRREAAVKKMSRKKKEALICVKNPGFRDLFSAAPGEEAAEKFMLQTDTS